MHEPCGLARAWASLPNETSSPFRLKPPSFKITRGPLLIRFSAPFTTKDIQVSKEGLHDTHVLHGSSPVQKVPNESIMPPHSLLFSPSLHSLAMESIVRSALHS